jgi:tRNA (cytosine34-C5)-methyltransferase
VGLLDPHSHNSLNQCYSLRIFPHDQDSGAFFVAVLKKTSVLPWESNKEKLPEDESSSGKLPGVETSSEKLPEVRKEPERKRRRIQGYREDPYVFFAEDEPVWLSVK